MFRVSGFEEFGVRSLLNNGGFLTRSGAKGHQSELLKVSVRLPKSQIYIPDDGL